MNEVVVMNGWALQEVQTAQEETFIALLTEVLWHAIPRVTVVSVLKATERMEERLVLSEMAETVIDHRYVLPLVGMTEDHLSIVRVVHGEIQL